VGLRKGIMDSRGIGVVASGVNMNTIFLKTQNHKSKVPLAMYTNIL
jgi:hypothetical protein